MNWQTLMCLGDSITIGTRSYLGYPEACCGVLHSRLGQHWNAVNFATAGYRVIDLARALDRSYADLQAARPGIITILIGTNDAKQPTPEAAFTLAYEQVLIKSRLIAGHSNVILIPPPRLGPGMLYPYLPAMNSVIDRYAQIIGLKAQEHGLRSLNLTLQPEHFFDGVHLNDAGAMECGEQLARFILNDKDLAHPTALPQGTVAGH